MWIWAIRQGAMIRTAQTGVLKGNGYSGLGTFKNDPAAQQKQGQGPIPVGAYAIGPETVSDEHGPVAMHLIPLPGCETYHRSAFLIHGDSKEHPGAASHGCIILPRSVREEVAASMDKLLVVVPDLELVPKAAVVTNPALPKED